MGGRMCDRGPVLANGHPRRPGGLRPFGAARNQQSYLLLRRGTVAIGVQGATASMVAADAVLGVNELVRLSETRTIALRTRRDALESVIAGLSLSIVAMGVAAAGQLPAVWGALLQEGIDVAVTGNATGALRFRSEEAPPPSAQAGEPRVGPKGAGDLSNPCLRGAA